MLIPCPDCSVPASVNAVSCANCGAPLRKYRQKAKAQTVAKRTSSIGRQICKFSFTTFTGNVLLLTPILWISIVMAEVHLSDNESFLYDHRAGPSISLYSLEQDWRYHSLVGFALNLHGSTGGQFKWDPNYSLPENVEAVNGVDSEFYRIVVKAQSKEHFAHLLQLGRKITGEHRAFHEHGDDAQLARAIVAMLEAGVSALLMAGMIASVRPSEPVPGAPA